MVLKSLDITIFVAFLVLNLMVGLRFWRNKTSLRQFAIGDKSFSTVLISISILATFISGSGFKVYIEKLYSDPIVFMFPLVGNILGLYLFTLIATRLGEFMNHLSIAESMGSLYGGGVRYITALSGIVINMGKVAVQFRVASLTFQLLFGMQSIPATIIAATIVIFYCAFGGIRAVTFTDFIQFLTFGLFIPILVWIIWYNLKDQEAVYTTIKEHPMLSFSKIAANKPLVCVGIAYFFTHLMSPLSPAVFQRALISKDVFQAKKAFQYSTLIWILISFSFLAISILLRTDVSKLVGKSFMSHIIHSCPYQGFKGLMASGVMAMVMSTADSCFHSSSILFANDLMNPLDILEKNKIRLARIFAILSGGLALFLSLSHHDIIDLVYLTSSFYFPIISIPLILAIVGFRSTKKSVLIGMIGGIITTAGFYHVPYLRDLNINSVTPGIFANLLCFLCSHYLFKQSGGWIGIKDQAPLLAEKYLRQRAWNKIFESIKGFNICQYMTENLLKKEGFHFIFGMYVLGGIYFSLFSIPKEALVRHCSLFNYLLYSTLGTNTLIMLSPLLPNSKKNKVKCVIWYLGIFYILFVATPVLVMISNYSIMLLTVFVGNLLLSFVIFNPTLALVMISMGQLIVMTIFTSWLNIDEFPVITDPSKIIFIYAMLFVGSFIGILNLKEKKAQLTQRYQFLDNLYLKTLQSFIKLKNSPHRLYHKLSRGNINGFSMAHVISSHLPQEIMKIEDQEDKHAIAQKATVLSTHIQDCALHIEKVLHYIENEINLEHYTLPLEDLLNRISNKINEYPFVPHPSPQLIIQNHSKTKGIQCDVDKISILIYSTIQQMQDHTSSPYFFLHITDSTIHYPTYAKNGLSALAFSVTTSDKVPAIEAAYLYVDNPWFPPPTNNKEFYHNQLETVIHAHYGFVDVKKAPSVYTFILPTYLNVIRPKPIEEKKRKLFSPSALRKTIQAEINFWKAVDANQSYDLLELEQATLMMKAAHKYQARLTEEPYSIHLFEVARYVCESGGNQTTLIAALLHDTIEDTLLTPEEISKEFGPRVKELVLCLSNLEVSFGKYNLEDNREKVKKLHVMGDRDAVHIKLCDHRHNIENLSRMSKTKQRRKIRKTWKVYIPLAYQYGFYDIGKKLEEICILTSEKK